MHLLIFEPESRGHPPQYVTVLTRYLRDRYPTGTVTFAIPEGTVKRLPADVRQAFHEGSSLCLRVLTFDELKRVDASLPMHRRSFARWDLAVTVAREVDAQALLFLLLDEVLLAAAFFSESGLRVSGILFRPTIHMPEYRRSWEGRIRQAIKSFLMRRTLLRHDLTAVLSLDPTFPAYARCYRCGDKVHALPESVMVPRHRAGAREPGPVRFLLFGALEARKGVFQLLDALSLLSAADSPRYQVHICGGGSISRQVAIKVAALQEKGAPVTFREGFVPDTELDDEIARCDVILAPYIGHIGSSSLLHIAAGLCKPVLGPAEGLLGRQIVEYSLGRAVDTTSSKEIADAMRAFIAEVVAGNASSRRFEDFVVGQGAPFFAATVLSHAMGVSEMGQKT